MIGLMTASEIESHWRKAGVQLPPGWQDDVAEYSDHLGVRIREVYMAALQMASACPRRN